MLEIVSNKPVQRPANLLTDFFTGDVEAWGLVAPRFSGRIRKFSLEMNGSWVGPRLILAESFEFSDGQIDNRTWEFVPSSDGSFDGRCDELAKWKSGWADSETLEMKYLFRLQLGERTLPVWFDDRMYQIDERTIANRAVMHKFGVRLGEVNAVFRKRSL